MSKFTITQQKFEVLKSENNPPEVSGTITVKDKNNNNTQSVVSIQPFKVSKNTAGSIEPSNLNNLFESVYTKIRNGNNVDIIKEEVAKSVKAAETNSVANQNQNLTLKENNSGSSNLSVSSTNTQNDLSTPKAASPTEKTTSNSNKTSTFNVGDIVKYSANGIDNVCEIISEYENGYIISSPQVRYNILKTDNNIVPASKDEIQKYKNDVKKFIETKMNETEELETVRNSQYYQKLVNELNEETGNDDAVKQTFLTFYNSLSEDLKKNIKKIINENEVIKSSLGDLITTPGGRRPTRSTRRRRGRRSSRRHTKRVRRYA